MVLEELEQLRQDRERIEKGEATGVVFLWPERPCPCPAECDFTAGHQCRTCRRKRGLHRETIAMRELSRAVLGGMPVGADELSWEQWKLLGELRPSGWGF